MPKFIVEVSYAEYKRYAAGVQVEAKSKEEAWEKAHKLSDNDVFGGDNDLHWRIIEDEPSDLSVLDVYTENEWEKDQSLLSS